MRVRRRKFSDVRMQLIYDQLRANPPENLNAFQGRGSVSNAYVIGFQHPDKADRYVRNSPAYAGWAAGVDNARAAARKN